MTVALAALLRSLPTLVALAWLMALGGGQVASANSVNSGSDCNYARPGATQAASAGAESGDDQIFVYDGTGSTGNAGTTAVGVCVNEARQGGFVESGTGGPGTYAVYDGSDNNPYPTNGYAGLSNYEDGSPDPTPCNGNDNDGDPTSTNGGGCIGIKAAPATNVPVPSAVPSPICGDTSGPDWNRNSRDGCFIVGD